MSLAGYNAEDYAHMGRVRERAFGRIAERLGKKHPIVQMMGALAWGRHPWELGPSDAGRLRPEVERKAALDGVFHVLNVWARDNDTAAQRVMLSEWTHGYQKAPGGR